MIVYARTVLNGFYSFFICTRVSSYYALCNLSEMSQVGHGIVTKLKIMRIFGLIGPNCLKLYKLSKPN